MFKKNCLSIQRVGRPLESFALDGNVPFGTHVHASTQKITLNCWVDFVDIDASDIVGGSEVYALIWGLRISEDAFRKEGAAVETTAVSFEQDENVDVSALFFANEFFRVSELSLKTLGQGRFQVYLKVQDITEESDAYNTEVWIDGTLADEPCEMSYPE